MDSSREPPAGAPAGGGGDGERWLEPPTCPILAGLIGQDRTAQDLKKLLKAAGIETRHLVVDRGRRTVLKERVVSERQQLLRIDYESLHELERPGEDALASRVKAAIRLCDAIILEDYAKGMLTPGFCRGLFAAARKARKIVTVDPNAKGALEMYRGATVLTPNTREAESLSGIKIRDSRSLDAVGRKLLLGSGARYVVITRGKDGMAIFSRGDRKVRLIPTFAREVYDVSGAGDTVIAVLTLALASQATIEEAAVLGNLAAGVEVGKRGTATVSPDEIRVAMDLFDAVGGPKWS